MLQQTANNLETLTDPVIIVADDDEKAFINLDKDEIIDLTTATTSKKCNYIWSFYKIVLKSNNETELKESNCEIIVDENTTATTSVLQDDDKLLVRQVTFLNNVHRWITFDNIIPYGKMIFGIMFDTNIGVCIVTFYCQVK